MSDLVAFLRECLADDERVARAAEGHNVEASTTTEGYLHLLRWGAARMLAEVESKREILKRHQPRTVTVADYEQYMPDVVACSTCSYPHGTSVSADEYQPYPCPTVRALLIPYVDRPGYDPAWKVES